MGYYVKLMRSDVVIPLEHLEEAYHCMCRLNTNYHDLKRGGSWSNGEKVEKWFSWMDSNYPETCNSVEDILDELGFEFYINDVGLTPTGYDNKTGQEDLFFRSISHLIKPNSIMAWQGEDGERWVLMFVDNGMWIARNLHEYPEEFMPDFDNPEQKSLTCETKALTDGSEIV